MLRITTLFISALLLVGCASPIDQATKDLQSWGPVAKEEAKAGKIKWSDYYKGLYERLRLTKFIDTPFMMEVASSLIDASLAYEAGTLNQNQFESLQRQAEISIGRNTQQLTEAQQIQQRAAWANAMQNLANQQRGTSQFYQDQLNKRQTCNTRWIGYQWQTVCQ